MEDIGTPTGPSIKLALPSSVAAKLAVYVGQNLALLGPRGWSCFGSSGPNANTLEVYSPAGSAMSGPAIVLSVNAAEDLGGIYLINTYGGRYFPKIILRRDIEAFMSNSSAWPPAGKLTLFPLKPRDKLSYIDSTALEFNTPARYAGLGPALIPYPDEGYTGKKSRFDITGLMRLVESDSHPYLLETMAAALPRNLAYLKSPIIDFARTCILQDAVPVTGPYCGIQANYPDNSN